MPSVSGHGVPPRGRRVGPAVWTHALPGPATSRELRAFAPRCAASGGRGGRGDRPGTGAHRGAGGLMILHISRESRRRAPAGPVSGAETPVGVARSTFRPDSGGGVASKGGRVGAEWHRKVVFRVTRWGGRRGDLQYDRVDVARTAGNHLSTRLRQGVDTFRPDSGWESPPFDPTPPAEWHRKVVSCGRTRRSASSAGRRAPSAPGRRSTHLRTLPRGTERRSPAPLTGPRPDVWEGSLLFVPSPVAKPPRGGPRGAAERRPPP